MVKNSVYQQRRDRLVQTLNETEMDAFLVGSREGIYYLTGASYVPEERPFFILIQPEKTPVLIVPKLEKVHMEKSGMGSVRAYTEFPAPKGETWADVLLSCLDEVKKLGVEPDVPGHIMEQLNEVSPVLSPILEQMRQVKTRDEIEMISRTAAYADIGMKEILKASYSGATVVEIFSRSRAVQARVIRETDYDPMESAFLMAAWPAPFSAQPHGIPGVGDRMGKGPLVSISYLRVNGYAAEVERTYFHHIPTKEEQDIFHDMMKARALGVSMIRPGMRCHDIDQAVYDYLLSHGYEKYLLHRTGHGIGLGNHEGPFVARGSRDVLAENMVISIEPGIYIPEIGGFRHSDTYQVTGKGCKVLTRYPDDLESLTLTGAKPLRRIMGKLMCRSLGIK